MCEPSPALQSLTHHRTFDLEHVHTACSVAKLSSRRCFIDCYRLQAVQAPVSPKQMLCLLVDAS